MTRRKRYQRALDRAREQATKRWRKRWGGNPPRPTFPPGAPKP